MPVCTVMSDVNLDLLRCYLPHFSDVKLLISPLQLISILWADTLKLCKSCFSLNFHPLVLAFIDYSCLSQLLLCGLPKCVFQYFFSWHCITRKSFSFPLFILLYQYESMHLKFF